VQQVGKHLLILEGGGGLMYAARLITVILLVMAILIAYSPQFREQATETWETIKPAVVGLMDGLYATIRNFIVGDGAHDRMEETPNNPGVNFDRIVTMSNILQD
jgi:hypothetical protein